jgi:hypothetical protein
MPILYQAALTRCEQTLSTAHALYACAYTVLSADGLTVHFETSISQQDQLEVYMQGATMAAQHQHRNSSGTTTNGYKVNRYKFDSYL